MGLQVALLRGSFQVAIERQPQLVRRLYEILFERFPQAFPLFGRHSIAQQEDLVARALVAVLDNLEDPAWLSENLKALGARHRDYGITDEMYGWVGASLLATLAEIAGADWTPELATAWTDAYGAISQMMREG
jgi:hemoglobin-like flavoprotein